MYLVLMDTCSAVQPDESCNDTCTITATMHLAVVLWTMHVHLDIVPQDACTGYYGNIAKSGVVINKQQRLLTLAHHNTTSTFFQRKIHGSAWTPQPVGCTYMYRLLQISGIHWWSAHLSVVLIPLLVMTYCNNQWISHVLWR